MQKGSSNNDEDNEESNLVIFNNCVYNYKFYRFK